LWGIKGNAERERHRNIADRKIEGSKRSLAGRVLDLGFKYPNPNQISMT